MNSENQKGDVPRNYIRFGRGDVVEWKEVRKYVFAGFKRVAGSTIASLEKVDAGRLSSAE